jgi:hypothetical protein
MRTQSDHFVASLIAFVTLEACRCRQRLNHFALKARLYRSALASAFAELQRLKAACPDGRPSHPECVM